MNINCLECNEEIAVEDDCCPACQWTYDVDVDEEGMDTPVCVHCFKEYDILEHYCQGCGHAVGRYTEYQPFESIRFSYSIHRTLWHRVWHEKDVGFGRMLYSFVALLIIAPVYFCFIPIGLVRVLFQGARGGSSHKQHLNLYLLLLFVSAVVDLVYYVLYATKTGAGYSALLFLDNVLSYLFSGVGMSLTLVVLILLLKVCHILKK